MQTFDVEIRCLREIMKTSTKLTIAKSIHAAIWLFFNVVIFYMAYAVIINKSINGSG